MQYYFTMLLLHRPFIDLNEAVATISHVAEGQPNATWTCTLAATNIAKLARDYSLFYSIKQIASPAIHFIFIAATIHLINHQISPSETHEYLFQGCLASLAEIGEGYPMSHKAVLSLQDLAARLRAHSSRTNRHLTSNQAPGPSSPSLERARSRSTVYNDTGSTLGPWATGPTGEPVEDHYFPDQLADISQSNEAPNTAPGNFDWSNYNSPIVLPPSLNIFDMEALDFVGDTLNGFPSQLEYVPNSAMRSTDLQETRYPWPSSYHNANHDAMPSAAVFDNFYGTSLGLA